MSPRPLVSYRVVNLEQAIDEPDEALRARACERAGLDPEALRGFRIVRRALDARRRGRRGRLRFVVHVEVSIDAGTPPGQAFEQARRSGHVVDVSPPTRLVVDAPHPSTRGATVAVVGSGPAGLFAALALARNGVAVELIDRGAPLEERGRSVAGFVRTRDPDPESNLLFGEGGAGTYSDGKLYTRVDHPLEALLLEELVACGAQDEIRYDARAHIGTDRLHRVLPRLRERLAALGVRFHWHTRLDALVTDAGPPRRVRALRCGDSEIPCDAVVLAPGHSARDTLRALAAQGLAVEAKPFQLGVRIEHPQALIDEAWHGAGPEAALLGPASYGLVSKASHDAAAAHSFCMCPGGQIVASVNAKGLLCTNGMSNSLHSSPFATAAIVTTLGPAEFGDGPFAGVAFQEAIEARFFAAGGSDYTAPAQRAHDFLAGRLSSLPPRTSYKLGVSPGRIDTLLPARVRDAVGRALGRFDRRIPGYAGPDGLLVGVESRSAGPIRLPRDAQTRRAAGFCNLFPVGEGAGWAGGIMSAAIDGASSAQALLRHGVR